MMAMLAYGHFDRELKDEIVNTRTGQPHRRLAQSF
jgi:hypothetical protein